MQILCYSFLGCRNHRRCSTAWMVRLWVVALVGIAPMLHGCAESNVLVGDPGHDAHAPTPAILPVTPWAKPDAVVTRQAPQTANLSTTAARRPPQAAADGPSGNPIAQTVAPRAPAGAIESKVAPPSPPIRVEAVWSGKDGGANGMPRLTLTATRSPSGPSEIVRLGIALKLQPSGRTTETEVVSLELPAEATMAKAVVALPRLQPADDDSSLTAELHDADATQTSAQRPSITMVEASVDFPSRERLAFEEASKDPSFTGAPALIDYLDHYKTGQHRQDALRLLATAIESGPNDRCETDTAEALAKGKLRFPAEHERAQRTIAAREDYDNLRQKIDGLTDRNLYEKAEHFAQKYPASGCRPLVELWLHEAYWRERATTPPAILALADYYVAEGRAQSAIEALKPAIALRYMPAMALAGRLKTGLGDAAGAAEVLQSVAKSDSGADPAEIGAANYQLGMTAEQRNRPSEALHYFDEALRADPSCAECLIARGQIKFLLTADWNAERNDLEAAVAAAASAPGRWPGAAEKAKQLLEMHDTRS